jgi:hypothetical protein
VCCDGDEVGDVTFLFDLAQVVAAAQPEPEVQVVPEPATAAVMAGLMDRFFTPFGVLARSGAV